MTHSVAALAIPFIASLVAALVLTPLVRRLARSLQMVANPVADRWHQLPTPVMGGVAVFGGFVVGGLVGFREIVAAPSRDVFSSNSAVIGIIAASSLMFVIGLIDDKLKLRPASKLIGQILGAAIVISLGVTYPVTPWAFANVLVTLFWFVGITNALNLLDNMDGVAVGVAAIAAIFLGATFALDGVYGMAGVCFALAGALLGFLPFNFRPASIFMGDSGSLFIGALLAGLGAAYPSRASASIVSVMFVPAIIVIIPILDTAIVTIARTLAGRSIAVGGRDHTSHRLVSMGLSQRQVALLMYAFAIGGGGLALLLRGAPPQLGLPIGGVLLVGFLIGAAHLGRLHRYDASSAKQGAVSVLVSDLFHKRRAVEVLLDIMLFAAAYQFAYVLRWDADLPPDQSAILGRTLAIAVVAKSLSFGIFGVYKGDWHRLSMPDVPRLAGATVVGALLTLAALVVMYPTGGYARAIFMIDAMLVVLLTTGARIAFRALDSLRAQQGIPVLVYGAGRAGELAVREMLANPELALRPIGFVDDDRGKRGRLVQGYPVVGGIDEIPALVRSRGVRTIVVGSKKVDATALARLRASCEALNVEILQLQLEFQPLADDRPSMVSRESAAASLLQ
jgi:UDP-GlcNAc:undecaprenyl-phosphate/decaprenyl-phosphate GlcNAc-1-phosphate transferase